MMLVERLLLATAALLQTTPPASTSEDGGVLHPGVSMKQPLTATSAAAKALLEAATHRTCSLILLTSGEKSTDTEFQTWETWQGQHGGAVFRVMVDRQEANVTQRLARLVPLARRVRQLSWCTMVVVVSHDPAFLAAFAEWSLRGRLLVWSTRLLVVTRLALPQLRALLPVHWTFSMMNTLFLTTEDTSRKNESPLRVFSHMPYSSGGPQTVQVASWTQLNGIIVTKGHALFQEKFSNFHGALVSVTALPYGPFWQENATLYSGTDYYTLAAIAHALNFTIRLVPTTSWAELLQLVVERRVLFASVVHTVLPHRLEKIDFSIVYEMSTISFCMAPPALTAQWQALYYPLSHTVWIATFLVLLLTPVAFIVLIRKMGDLLAERSEEFSFGAVLHYMTGIFLGQSLLHRLPRNSSSRVLLAAWLVFALIIGSAYSGNLTASLTLPKYPPRPETLPQLVEAVDRITMQPYGEEFRHFFANSDSPVFQKLATLIDFVPSLVEGQRQAVERNQAHLDNQRYQHHSIAETYTRADGKELLYIGRESIMPGQSAWPLPHDAPYTAVIDRNLMAVVEGGLYEKWGDDLLFRSKQESRNMQKHRLNLKKEVDSSPSLTIRQMQGAFMILSLGLGVAVLIFAGEALVCRMYTTVSL